MIKMHGFRIMNCCKKMINWVVSQFSNERRKQKTKTRQIIVFKWPWESKKIYDKSKTFQWFEQFATDISIFHLNEGILKCADVFCCKSAFHVRIAIKKNLCQQRERLVAWWMWTFFFRIRISFYFKNKMQKIHTISTASVMNTVSNTSTTSDLIASVVAGHAINSKNNSNKKINSSGGVSNNINSNNNNNNHDRAANINENGSALKIVKPIAPAKPIGKHGKFWQDFSLNHFNFCFSHFSFLSVVPFILPIGFSASNNINTVRQTNCSHNQYQQ